MKYLHVNSFVIPYNITKKGNKNTYFYFKRDGYIQINLSKYQSINEALDYIKKHPEKFIVKLQSIQSKPKKNTQIFLLLGNQYSIQYTKDINLYFQIEENQIMLPTNDVNHPIIKAFYKEKMSRILMELHQKYLSNPYVNLRDVTYKTRYTTSRHGSCNPKKKTININLYLVQYDIKYIEYVYLHEITHLNHPNHGTMFYDLLHKLCPNYIQLKKELREIYR